jgi:hypothetical protein
MKSLSFKNTIDTLKLFQFEFNAKQENEKLNFLKTLSHYKVNSKKQFLQIHQILLCMMAYPSTKPILNQTELTLREFILNNKETALEKLTGTGIYNSYIECNFSFSKINFLIKKFPGQIYIHSSNSTTETQLSVLKIILPYIEYSEIHNKEKNLKKIISKFNKSQKTDLEWLVELIEGSNESEKVKSFIFDQLAIFITWKITDIKQSVSFIKGFNQSIFFHDSISKKADLTEIIKQKLPLAVKLNEKEKTKICDAARLTLTYLYRETEPFTHSNTNDITLFQLERGLSIALFGSNVLKRYSIESYIGYIVFKNNIPVSYGGGWIFGERCQFGINILESFRGGESTLIICELLRVYHNYFGATNFVVKPYQFGLHNLEAIKTGAFWFYYKLGFRPQDENLKKLAKFEENEKVKNPKYKSPVKNLKKYTQSNIELILSNNSYPNFDAEIISKKITAFINTYFNSNRKLAESTCYKKLINNLLINTNKWDKETIEFAKQYALLFHLKPDNEKWQQKYKNEIIKFIELKTSANEIEWLKHSQKFNAYWKYIIEL